MIEFLTANWGYIVVALTAVVFAGYKIFVSPEKAKAEALAILDVILRNSIIAVARWAREKGAEHNEELKWLIVDNITRIVPESVLNIVILLIPSGVTLREWLGNRIQELWRQTDAILDTLDGE